MTKITELLALTATITLAAPPEGQGDIERAVRSYAAAADARDVVALERASSPDMRISFVADGGKPVTISRADFVALLQAGKAGGVTRTVQMLGTVTNGTFGAVHVILVSPSATFDTLFSLLKTDAGWVVTGDATVVVPAPKP